MVLAHAWHSRLDLGKHRGSNAAWIALAAVIRHGSEGTARTHGKSAPRYLRARALYSVIVRVRARDGCALAAVRQCRDMLSNRARKVPVGYPAYPTDSFPRHKSTFHVPTARRFQTLALDPALLGRRLSGCR